MASDEIDITVARSCVGGRISAFTCWIQQAMNAAAVIERALQNSTGKSIKHEATHPHVQVYIYAVQGSASCEPASSSIRNLIRSHTSLSIIRKSSTILDHHLHSGLSAGHLGTCCQLPRRRRLRRPLQPCCLPGPSNLYQSTGISFGMRTRSFDSYIFFRLFICFLV